MSKTGRYKKTGRCKKTRRRLGKTRNFRRIHKRGGGIFGEPDNRRDKEARDWLENLGQEWRVGQAGRDSTIQEIEKRLNRINGLMGAKYKNLSSCLMEAGNINGERVTAYQLITFKQCVEPDLIELFELMSDKDFLKRDLIEKYSGYKREIEELFKAFERQLTESVVVATGATPTDIDRDVKKILSYNIEKFQRKESKEAHYISALDPSLEKTYVFQTDHSQPEYTGLGGKRIRSGKRSSKRSGKRSSKRSSKRSGKRSGKRSRSYKR